MHSFIRQAMQKRGAGAPPYRASYESYSPLSIIDLTHRPDTAQLLP